MNSKLSDWLLRDEEKFLSIVQDEQERKKYLSELYRSRIISLIVTFILLSLGVVGMFVGGASSSTGSLLLILPIIFALRYLEADSRIRAIRLYELATIKAKPRS